MGRPKGSKNKSKSAAIAAVKAAKAPKKSKTKTFSEYINSLVDSIRTGILDLGNSLNDALGKDPGAKLLEELSGYVDVLQKTGEELDLVATQLPTDYNPGEEKPLVWEIGAVVNFKAAFSKAFALHDDYVITQLIDMGKGPGMGTHVSLTLGDDLIGTFSKSQLELIGAPKAPAKASQPALPFGEDAEDHTNNDEDASEEDAPTSADDLNA